MEIGKADQEDMGNNKTGQNSGNEHKPKVGELGPGFKNPL